MCDGKACPCDVDYEDDNDYAYREGYKAGYKVANEKWYADHLAILNRLAQIRELAR